MALVVPWHAGIFFTARGQGGLPLGAALWLSHAFRMPLFFLLAGFLGATATARHGDGAWLRGRAVRLGVPLVVGVIALAPLAGMLDAWVNEKGASATPSLAALANLRPDYLWFLWYLLIISVGWLALRALGRGFRHHREIAVPLRDHAGSAWTIALLAAPCAFALWCAGAWQAAPPNTFAPPAGLLAYYAIFFAVGWLLGGRATGIEALAGHPRRRLATALAVSVPAFLLFIHSGDPGIASEPAIRFAALYLSALCGWLLIAGLIGFCRRYLSQERATLRYAADASYWIYLSHMLFLIPLQLLLVGLFLPGAAQFAVAVAVTFGLTLITYELFVRYSPIGSVLHGDRGKRPYSLRLSRRFSRLPATAAAPPA
jgi:fucose 4-O-acetylase-like acetyltransferase